MNILFINSIQMFGGGEVWMLRTLNELRQRGHKVYLICRPNTELAERAREQHLEVYTIKMRGDFDPVTIWQCARLFRKLNVDVVLTNMDKELRFAGLAARLGHQCVIISRRGIDYPLKNKLHYRFSYNVLADAIIANSNATKNSLLRNAPWLDPKRIVVIYNGVHPETFDHHSIPTRRAKWGIRPTDRVIGFIGQLDERKGLHALLKAFERTANRHQFVHLVLVGKGPLHDWIASKRLDRVHLVGFDSNIPAVIKSIDCLVLPSRWEGFGIVLIEAMAGGKPCITTRVSSMPEIVVDGQTGIVVPVDDVDALDEAMTFIAENPKKSTEWGAAGKERVEQMFRLDRSIDELEDFIIRLIEEKS